MDVFPQTLHEFDVRQRHKSHKVFNVGGGTDDWSFIYSKGKHTSDSSLYLRRMFDVVFLWFCVSKKSEVSPKDAHRIKCVERELLKEIMSSNT